MSALIAARPGPLQEGLQALLKTLPQIDRVDQVYDLAAAYRAITGGHPDLVLLDTGLADRAAFSLVRDVKTAGRQSHCLLVLVDTVRQQEEAESAGADIALPQGCSAAKLIAAIEDLARRRTHRDRQGLDKEGKDQVAIS